MNDGEQKKKKKKEKQEKNKRRAQAVCSLFECALIYDNLRTYEAFFFFNQTRRNTWKNEERLKQGQKSELRASFLLFILMGSNMRSFKSTKLFNYEQTWEGEEGWLPERRTTGHSTGFLEAKVVSVLDVIIYHTFEAVLLRNGGRQREKVKPSK